MIPHDLDSQKASSSHPPRAEGGCDPRIGQIALRVILGAGFSLLMAGGAMAIASYGGVVGIIPLSIIGGGTLMGSGLIALLISDQIPLAKPLPPSDPTDFEKDTPSPPSNSESDAPPVEQRPRTRVPDYESEDEEVGDVDIGAIQGILRDAENQLKSLNRLEKVKELLTGGEIQAFQAKYRLGYDTPYPQDIQQTWAHIHDLGVAVDRLQKVWEEYQHFYKYGIMDDNGLCTVPDDGNCLYHAFLVPFRMLTRDEISHEQLREQTVRWTANYMTESKRFVIKLLDAMACHFEENEDFAPILLERQNMRVFTLDPTDRALIEYLRDLRNGESDAKADFIEDRMKEIGQFYQFLLNGMYVHFAKKLEQEKAPSERRDQIEEWLGSFIPLISGNHMPLSPDDPALATYLKETSQPTEFASFAELWAVSKIKEIRIEVFDGKKELHTFGHEFCSQGIRMNFNQSTKGDHFNAVITKD